MRSILFIALGVTLLASGVAPAAAQDYGFDREPVYNPYSYTYRNGHTLKVNWDPETRRKSFRRYTVGITPSMLLNHGLRMEFEAELRPGEWLQTGVTGYRSPRRQYRNSWVWWDDDRQHYLPVSGFEGFNRMWGVGAQLLFKKFFHRRGWYFSTGIVVTYFNVERTDYGYHPFDQAGLRMWERGPYDLWQWFVRPSVQFNVGKHFAVSRHCFFDIYAGSSFAWSIYKRRAGDEFQPYDTMWGFARRYIDVIHGGARFGVLLWTPVRRTDR